MNLALPVNIKELLSNKLVESDRIEFKKGWNPKEVMHTMSAFANDINNWGGGYIIIGIDAEDGKAIMPPTGVEATMIDKIQGELLGLSNLISPSYFPIIKEELIRKKYILIIWCPAGDYRPYRAPQGLGKELGERHYYVRKNARTLRAKESDLQLLYSLAAKVPFDDRMNTTAAIDDLDLGLIREFLNDVKSDLFADSIKIPFVDLCIQMNIAKGPKEALKPTNVGLLFFCKNPHRFHERARIELVIHQGYTGRQFVEKIFKGPLHYQVRDVLRFIKSEIIKETVIKKSGQAAAKRYFNFPFEAVEEIVTNAVYHKGYDINSPIEIQVFPHRMDVLSYPGPIPPVDNKLLRNKRNVLAREYRNRRIGDLLKELNLTEGRGTGIPIVYHACEINGSPVPVFETNDERTYFLATLFTPDATDESQFLINIPNRAIPENTKSLSKENGDLEKIHKAMLKTISNNSSISRDELAEKFNLSISTVQRYLDKLRANGYIIRHGSYKGYWEVRKK